MSDHTLHLGDCLETMRGMPDACVTAVVTDPPYGLSFMGKDWDHGIPGEAFWAEALRVAKPGSVLMAFGGTRTYHRLACAIEDAGWEIRDCLSWMYGSGFPKSLGIGKAIDKAAGAEREVVGVNPNGGRTGDSKYGQVVTDGSAVLVTAPATDAAKEWDGYGTALKPAWEPCILAMKPLDGTFAANAQEHGVAGLNIDGGRIDAIARPLIESRAEAAGNTFGDGLNGSRSAGVTDKGRWPANVALDDEAAALLDEQTKDKLHGAGCARSGSAAPRMENHDPSSYTMNRNTGDMHRLGDSGGASRFFYTAKTSKADRNFGLPDGSPNAHPTVKPTDLMRWLVGLVKMPQGTVILDPFMGSGSTGVACALEGVDFVGCELDEDYLEIARQRIEAAHALAKMPARSGENLRKSQPKSGNGSASLFD